MMRGDSVQLIWCREGLKYSACGFLTVRRGIYWTSCRNYWLLALEETVIDETAKDKEIAADETTSKTANDVCLTMHT